MRHAPPSEAGLSNQSARDTILGNYLLIFNNIIGTHIVQVEWSIFAVIRTKRLYEIRGRHLAVLSFVGDVRNSHLYNTEPLKRGWQGASWRAGVTGEAALPSELNQLWRRVLTHLEPRQFSERFPREDVKNQHKKMPLFTVVFCATSPCNIYSLEITLLISTSPA